ncbi:MAG: nitroreductase family deazaflavin-dependent oxidoreductase [Acidimicrobiaceae bacterium]|nr:nitroreductase family deazaflavin-dependent oxidoreductase [Acidimicrobiaceae bacterium]MBO0748037.1 nitroreductase family deazaflavin-dependent oxidoreductase [Acidimicrobiaceae bacterium]
MQRSFSLERWFYPDKRPNRPARILNAASARMAAAGLGPRRVVSLEVRGRRSGRTISVPLVVADYQGQRYLASMLGEGSNWVRNLRAAGGRAVLRHGKREEVLLEEVDPAERAPILRRYLERAPGARPHIPVDRHAPLEEFEKVAPDIPIYRIVAV